MRRGGSLGWRLTLSHVTVTVIVLLTASLVFWAALVSEAEKYEAHRQAQFENAVLVLLQESQEAPEQVLLRLQHSFPAVDVMLHFSNPMHAAPVQDPVRTSLWDGGNLLVPYYRMEYGLAFFQFRMLTPVQEQARRVLTYAVAILAGGVLCALLLSWWLGRRLTRPLEQMAGITSRIAEGDFGQRLAPTGLEELDTVATRFNHMAAQLEESFRQLRQERDQARRFAGDAAHELKTPLTALKTYAEVAQTATDGRREQAVAAVLRQVGRLEHLVGGLTQLAALHEGAVTLLEQDDLRAATALLMPPCEEMASRVGHRFHVELAGEPLPVRLDRRLLELVLTNLVENACKFTPPGGQVTLSLGAADQEAFLAVADTGPGIPADELPHVFDRFHRGLSTQRIPGSGLGLSIVAKAVEHLGGRVEVCSREGEGSRFTVYLPLNG